MEQAAEKQECRQRSAGVPQTDRQIVLSKTADTHETEEYWKQVGGRADRPKEGRGKERADRPNEISGRRRCRSSDLDLPRDKGQETEQCQERQRDQDDSDHFSFDV